ncbi:MAG: hypothetical protein ACK4K0_01790 [Flavobacteriales bacterium]
MKKSKLTLGVAVLVLTPICIMLYAFTFKPTVDKPGTTEENKTCVFNTLFGLQPVDSFFIYKTPENVASSIESAMIWMAKAQQDDGGWGAGSHSAQHIRDPHAIKSDPATTAMVSMALLRNGSTPYSGPYKTQLNKGLEFILKAIEDTPDEQITITKLQGTQIQTKLGYNIDAVLASQFLSNVLECMETETDDYLRVKKNLNTCVTKILQSQDADGSIKGSGWAGVLQSSLANNALESAYYNGADVDKKALERSVEYQKSNYNASSGKVNTDKGAGIVLYSVSGSARASAVDAREAEEKIAQAKKEGKLNANDKVTVDNLEKIGYTRDQAVKINTSYEVFNSAKALAQSDEVTIGFGNNGGEEFLSFLQTGESMIIGGDRDWTKWYDNTSGKLLVAQNPDGSWSGHHCITSPVFCTATCLLILSVNNDAEKLAQTGKKK